MLDFALMALGFVLFILFLLVVPVRWTGNATRVILCRWCLGMYGYQMIRTVTAYGWAPFLIGRTRATRRAKLTAVRRVRRRLAEEPEPVPCPVCGRFQPDAYAAVRSTRYRWFRPVEGVAVAVSLLLPIYMFAGLVQLVAWAGEFDPGDPKRAGLIGTLFILSFPLAAAPWFGVYATRKFLQSRFHPNRDIPDDDRLALAWSRAVVADPDWGSP